MRVCELPWLFAYVTKYSHGVCYLYTFLFILLSNQPASHVAAPQCRSWAAVNFKHQNGENIYNERVLLVPNELVWVHLGSLISRGFQHHSLQILLFTWLMVRSLFGISSVNPVTQPAFSHQSGLVMWGWCFWCTLIIYGIFANCVHTRMAAGYNIPVAACIMLTHQVTNKK